MRNTMIGRNLLVIIFGLVLCEPPEQQSVVNYLNQTESEIILKITNYPIYVTQDSILEYIIEPSGIASVGCFTFSKSEDPIKNFIQIITTPSTKPKFQIVVNHEEVILWSYENNVNKNPFNPESWVYNSDNSSIDCGDYSDNGSSIIYAITDADLGLDE